MKELTQNQLRALRKDVEKGKNLADLLQRFPAAEIWVIRGYDAVSEEAYTYGAYFNEAEARRAAEKISSNSDDEIEDSYHIIKISIRDIELFGHQGKIDLRTEKSLDEKDREIIYLSLEQKLDELAD